MIVLDLRKIIEPKVRTTALSTSKKQTQMLPVLAHLQIHPGIMPYHVLLTYSTKISMQGSSYLLKIWFEIYGHTTFSLPTLTLFYN